MNLSAIIISKNEASNIERCIQSLSFCDEVVVIDSESSDNTVDLAKKLGAQVFVLPWKGFVTQRNQSIGFAKGNWILSVDADEVVSSELAEEIQGVISSQGAKAAYSVPRKTIHLGRWIKHGGWYPNRLVRLFRKAEGFWVGGEVHERWNCSSEVGELQSPLLHYSFADLRDQVDRNNHYSTLGAMTLKQNGKRFSTFRLLGKSASKFLETYFLKKGFLDGYPGFIIAVSAAYSVFLKWAKLWEMELFETRNEKT